MWVVRNTQVCILCSAIINQLWDKIRNKLSKNQLQNLLIYTYRMIGSSVHRDLHDFNDDVVTADRGARFDDPVVVSERGPRPIPAAYHCHARSSRPHVRRADSHSDDAGKGWPEDGGYAVHRLHLSLACINSLYCVCKCCGDISFSHFLRLVINSAVNWFVSTCAENCRRRTWWYNFQPPTPTMSAIMHSLTDNSRGLARRCRSARPAAKDNWTGLLSDIYASWYVLLEHMS